MGHSTAVNSSTVEGPGRAPTPPRWPEGWYLGQPDLIVTLPAGYTLPGEPSDVFRIFAVPLKVSGNWAEGDAVSLVVKLAGKASIASLLSSCD